MSFNRDYLLGLIRVNMIEISFIGGVCNFISKLFKIYIVKIFNKMMFIVIFFM